MEEKPNNLNDDLEILDFDDDIIIDDPPKNNDVIIEDVVEEPEIIEINDVEPQENKIPEPIEIEDFNEQKEEIKPIEINPVIENVADFKKENLVEKPEIKTTFPKEEPNIKNSVLLNQALNVDKKPSFPNEENTAKVNTNTKQEDETKSLNKAIIEEPKSKAPEPNTQVFVNEKVVENKKETSKNDKIKQNKGRGKAIFIGILIFAILLGTIIALPFLNDYINNNQINGNSIQNQTNNISNTSTEEFKSNIDVSEALEEVKDYKNYQYQNINTISTKDNTDQILSLKNSYTYLFNETKFNIKINKVVADFTYDVEDYYEKLDETYNLYINDITTKTYTKNITTKEEFDMISNIFPNMINYLINNYKIEEEKQVKVDNEDHIVITLKVSKDIINNLSIETDRIQNKIDTTKLSEDFIYVDLLFDEDDKLYKIEIEIEDKFAYQEQIENEVESAILKYTFTDFNKIEDITLPIVQ